MPTAVPCRYAGHAFETVEAAEAGRGVLMVKGLKSMWRQAAPILRTTLQGVLQRIIMQAGSCLSLARLLSVVSAARTSAWSAHVPAQCLGARFCLRGRRGTSPQRWSLWSRRCGGCWRGAANSPRWS